VHKIKKSDMEVASSVLTFIHSFVEICQLVQNLKGLRHTHLHTHPSLPPQAGIMVSA